MGPDRGRRQQRREIEGSGPCLANPRQDSLGDCGMERVR